MNNGRPKKEAVSKQGQNGQKYCCFWGRNQDSFWGIEREIPAEARKCFMEEGDGYADDYCKMDVFEQDPKRLRKMIAKEKKYARTNFERFDLEGNLEEVKKKNRKQ